MENKNNASYDYITNGNKMQTNKFYMQGGHETDTERQKNQAEMICHEIQDTCTCCTWVPPHFLLGDIRGYISPRAENLDKLMGCEKDFVHLV